MKHGQAGTITLTMGMMDRSGLWDWMEQVKAGYDYRRDVTIIQFNRSYKPVRFFQLTNAFPKKVSSTALDAMSSSMPVDECEVCYERIIPMIIPYSGAAALANVAGAAAGAAGKLF